MPGIGQAASTFAPVQPGAGVVADDVVNSNGIVSDTAETAGLGTGYVRWDVWLGVNPRLTTSGRAYMSMSITRPCDLTLNPGRCTTSLSVVES